MISKLDIELVATEEEKSNDAQDLRNIDATEERQRHHWIDIKKTCTALSNSQIWRKIEEQVFGQNWEDHRWEDLQNQLERIEIDGYSNLSKTSQNDSMNDLK